MSHKASVIIEKHEHGFYAWWAELKGCQSHSLEEAIANIKEAIELYLETLPAEERDFLLSREILTTAAEINALSIRAEQRVTVPFNGSAVTSESTDDE
jgi:predicted RNase H-like HicB family nuclease